MIMKTIIIILYLTVAILYWRIHCIIKSQIVQSKLIIETIRMHTELKYRVEEIKPLYNDGEVLDDEGNIDPVPWRP